MAKKIINNRCPLNAECGRSKCDYVGHEIDCTYYEDNGIGENSIQDQEERRAERERVRQEELEELAFAEIPDEEDPRNSNEATKIVMLPIDHLNPHPGNPRKDVGDVTELAESIKVNGILQNLTVVPYKSPVHNRVMDGMYTVIIGHRRLAAATLAGLDAVPCVIANMTDEEQISTMLTENMQRTDLTIYEQAKAFQQLSIDMGMSIHEIAEKSGFSEATVRKRTRLAELDEKSFKKACERGATLFDFAELDKIEEPEAKKRCLDAMGTQNFKNVMRTELDNQKAKKKMQKWISQLDTFATRIEQVDYIDGNQQGKVDHEYVRMNYYRNYGSWTRDEDVETPSDANKVRYFYRVSNLQINMYREVIVDSAEEEKRRKKEELRNIQEEAWEKMQEIQSRHKELRRDFILNYGSSKSNINIIMRNIADAMVIEVGGNYYRSDIDVEDLCNLLGIRYDEERNMPDRHEFSAVKAEKPEYLMLILAYWYLEDGRGYAKQKWDPDTQAYVIRYEHNDQLDNLYYFLDELGYERSDEERRLSRGEHELIYKESEAE